MPIKDLQKTTTEVGRIRLGIKAVGANGRERPQKLSTLRFTSPGQHLIEEIARLYGGDARPWQSPSGPQFEVITTVDEVPVYVARQLIDPWYEMGGNGFIQRRCDGETETKRNVPCLCNPEQRDCKPTTRLKVYLADVPGTGVWRLESHGWNAAGELGGDIADWIAALPDGVRLPGRLKVVARREKKLVVKNGQEKVETFDYMVPVLYFDQITSRQIAGGPAAWMPAIGAGAQQALGTAERAAIGAAPSAEVPEPPSDVEDWPVEFGKATTMEQMRGLWTACGKDGQLTPDNKAAWIARGKVIRGEVGEPAPADEVPAAAPVAAVAEGEVEPDKDEVWTRSLRLAGDLGWTTSMTTAAFREYVGKHIGDATGWEHDAFREHLRGLLQAVPV